MPCPTYDKQHLWTVHLPRLRATGLEGKLLAFEANKPPNEFSIDIWSLAKKARVSSIPVPSELTRATFNSSGTILFTASGETLEAWDVPSGKRRFSLSASGDIDLIVPDPSSTALAIVTHGHLTVLNGMTGARLAELPDMRYSEAAAFSPDGRYLLTGYDERTAALWIWRSDDLRDQACGRLNSNFSYDEWKRWLPKQPYRKICPNLPAPK